MKYELYSIVYLGTIDNISKFSVENKDKYTYMY